MRCGVHLQAFTRVLTRPLTTSGAPAAAAAAASAAAPLTLLAAATICSKEGQRVLC